MRLSGKLLPARTPGRPTDDPRDRSGLRGVVDISRRAVRQWVELTPRHYFKALRARRWMVLTLVLISTAGGGLATLLQTPMYKAEVQLFFSPNFPTKDIRQLDTGGNYILQRVRSYSEIADSPEVATTVIERLGLPYSSEELLSRVSVTGKASTAILNIEVLDPEPGRARDIANAIGAEMPGFIGRLEQPTGIDSPPVKVSVVRPATAPSAPESPQPVVNIGLALAGGLIVGTVTAVTAYARERTVRDADHAAEVADLTLVGVVEAAPGATRLLAPDERSARAEALRQTRATLRVQAVGERLTSVTVVGSAGDDGGALTAGNLAVAFARAGETVVLIDGNLRNPEIHELFAVPNETGLANVLRGEASVNDVTVQWRAEFPLYLLLAGRDESGPTERLFQPDKIADLMQSFRLGQVFVIVNGPPLLSDAEATFLVTATDATVVAARVGTTRTDQLPTTVDALRRMRANLLGLIAVGGTR
ncbi:Wzz/FepE/Etk N-terminal domain-containing protein [Micromonospora echinaurantiaca]|uniref:Wzz/FepE/Etk N-terminal domain-containing protein n=1 Tax=Micromonospora echinaurantiaca TaxID=47857 RepID=UPI003418FCB0